MQPLYAKKRLHNRVRWNRNIELRRIAHAASGSELLDDDRSDHGHADGDECCDDLHGHRPRRERRDGHGNLQPDGGGSNWHDLPDCNSDTLSKHNHQPAKRQCDDHGGWEQRAGNADWKRYSHAWLIQRTAGAFQWHSQLQHSSRDIECRCRYVDRFLFGWRNIQHFEWNNHGHGFLRSDLSLSTISVFGCSRRHPLNVGILRETRCNSVRNTEQNEQIKWRPSVRAIMCKLLIRCMVVENLQPE